MNREMKTFICCLMQIFMLVSHFIVAQGHLKVVTKPFYLDDNVFFELIEPKHISYTYKVRPAKDFGIILNRTLVGEELVPVLPIQGCSKFSNRNKIYNNIAFIQRGGCSFLSKTINAELAGAVAAIIYDHEFENDGRMIDMITDETQRTTGIPAFFLQGRDGTMIKHTLEQNHLPSAIINIPINVTGLPINTINQPPWTLW